MQSIKSQNAVITGANSGLGKSIEIKLAKEGVNVALIARNEE